MALKATVCKAAVQLAVPPILGGQERILRPGNDATTVPSAPMYCKQK